MACAPFAKAEDNLLGFLYSKNVIDGDLNVIDKNLANFYLPRFNSQLERNNIQGHAYHIQKGKLVPNSELLSMLDEPAPEARTGDEEQASKESYTEYRERVTSLQPQRIDVRQLADVDDNTALLVNQMAEAGWLTLKC